VKREFTLVLEDTEYSVLVEGDTITVNGRPFVVEASGDGAVVVDGITYDVALEGDRATVGGESYAVQVSGLPLKTGASGCFVSAASLASGDPDAPRAVEPGTGAVLAIMPGKVIRLLVKPGQEVQEGQAVCVLEAMKMENELQARQSGAVQVVHVEPGDDVEKGQVLVEIG
jgi:biotin carboxyl carrier protein